ncbi:universal stress protein [Actinomadura sp. NPDC023710]|uniref:universal stress protein n=1 Tax=Actinomadura sp. NPDC023710 TaxID=3158219 RepID=UPI0033D19364
MSTQRTAILVGTDGSAPSDRAIGWAADEAARLGGELHILHVLETPTKPTPGGTGGDTASLVDAWNPVLRAGRDAALRRHPDLKVVEDVVVGHPVQMLARASAEADLIVVGSRGRSFPLGSVGHGVIHHAHCPVAVVRPHD